MLAQQAVLFCLSAAAAAAGPPNIILYVVDDLGFADLSLVGAGVRTGHGHAQDYETPAIDKLASEGIMLDSYYVNRLCSPTRTSLLSSRYAYTLGLAGGVITNGFPVALRLNETTIADKLKPLGYQTHGFGKWDIGYHTWKHTPTFRGFDSWLGYYNADEDYFTHGCSGGECKGGKALDFRNGTAPLFDNTTYSTHVYTQEGLRILADHDPAKGPFFIYAAYQALHGPLEAPQKYLDECPQVTEADRHIFCGMAMALDEGIGNMTAMLEKLGLADNTIIVLTTDNGGQNGVGGNNFPLRGNKATVFEGGVRGNGFVWGGAATELFGNGAKGRLNTAMMHNVDWGPTFVAAAGGNASAVIETQKLDGLDIWPALVSNSFVLRDGELRGAIDYGPRTDVLLHLEGPNNGFVSQGWELTAALRMGDWKIVVHQKLDNCQGSMVNASGQHCLKEVTGWVEMQKDIASGKWATRSLEQPVVNQTCDDRLCLFNLRTDPFERNDVAALNPAVVAKLVARIGEYNATRIPNIKQPFDLNACPSNFPNDVWTPWLNSTPPLPGPSPPPFLGSVAAAGKWKKLAANTLGVSGWCCDPLLQNGTGPSTVTFHVTANGGATTQLGSQVADIFRPGVVAAGCASSKHGFDLRLDLSQFNTPGKKYLLYAVATRPASAGADTNHLISKVPVCFTGVTGAACGPDDN